MAQYNITRSFPFGSGGNNQQSASPNTNKPLEQTGRQSQQQDDIIAYRMITDGALCRNLTQNTDVVIKPLSFHSRHDYNRTIPGYEIIQRKNGKFVSGRVANGVVEGLGQIASVSASEAIVTANGQRFRAADWAFPNDNSTVNVGMELHFETLPPNKRNVSDRSSIQKKQSSLPMIIKAHAQSDCCFTVLRHRPQHWTSNNITSST